MKRLISVDAEASRLHGEVFAVAACVIEENGEVSARFCARAPTPSDVNRWVKEYVLPVIEGVPVDCVDTREMRDRFWEWYTRRQEDALVITDIGWPVETGLWSQCVADDPSREGHGPFPILDVSTLMFAVGVDPTTESREDLAKSLLAERTGKPHDPRWDAETSGLAALKLISYVRMLRASQASPDAVDSLLEKIYAETDPDRAMKRLLDYMDRVPTAYAMQSRELLMERMDIERVDLSMIAAILADTYRYSDRYQSRAAFLDRFKAVLRRTRPAEEADRIVAGLVP